MNPNRTIPLALAVLTLVGTFPAQSRAQETNAVQQMDFTTFSIISERNIFDPNRRARRSSARPPVKIVDSFSLVGTMIYDGDRYAVFDGTGSDYHKVVTPGGRIAGYAVTNIGLDGVELAAGSNRVDLKVGMQMRRNEDGRWSATDQTSWAAATYASNSSPDRHSHGHYSTAYRRTGSSSSPARSAATEVAGSPQNGAGTEHSEIRTGPAEPPGGESDDPVARMMRRRAEQLNGNDNSIPNQ